MLDKMRVAVIDDHPLFREGVVHTLLAEGDIEIVGQGASALEAIEVATVHQPDLLLLDMNMPGGGLAAIQGMVAGCPGVKILILTVVGDGEQVCAALQLGARGYVLKGVSGAELVQTVRTVHRGETYVSPGLAARLLARNTKKAAADADPFHSLTMREEQVVVCLSRGLSNKEIGSRLELSEKTVKHYLTSVLQKLHVRSRLEVALLASHRPANGTSGKPSFPGQQG